MKDTSKAVLAVVAVGLVIGGFLVHGNLDLAGPAQSQSQSESESTVPASTGPAEPGKIVLADGTDGKADRYTGEPVFYYKVYQSASAAVDEWPADSVAGLMAQGLSAEQVGRCIDAINNGPVSGSDTDWDRSGATLFARASLRYKVGWSGVTLTVSCVMA